MEMFDSVVLKQSKVKDSQRTRSLTDTLGRKGNKEHTKIQFGNKKKIKVQKKCLRN